MSNVCYPCAIHYDYIIDNAHLEEELEYVVAKANPKMEREKIDIDIVPKSIRNIAVNSTAIKSQLLLNLPARLVMDTLSLFNIDYQLFGYDKIASYVKLAFSSLNIH